MSLSEKNDVIKRISSISEMFFQGNTSALAREIGVKQSTLRDIISGKVKPSYDTITKFVENPTLNISSEWLLTGEGDMLKQPSEDSKSTSQIERVQQNGYETYLLPQSAMGGSLCGFAADGVNLQNCEKIISPIKEADFAITVYGDSMAPEYPSGSRVLIKRIDPSLFIEWGKVYVLDTPNGVVMKELLECKEQEFVICHSINPAPKYSDFKVRISDVFGIYRVMMCMSAK